MFMFCGFFSPPERYVSLDNANRGFPTLGVPVLPWMRLLYLQLRSFCLGLVFFTYGGGTIRKEDRILFLDGGEP